MPAATLAEGRTVFDLPLGALLQPDRAGRPLSSTRRLAASAKPRNYSVHSCGSVARALPSSTVRSCRSTAASASSAAS